MWPTTLKACAPIVKFTVLHIKVYQSGKTYAELVHAEINVGWNFFSGISVFKKRICKKNMLFASLNLLF